MSQKDSRPSKESTLPSSSVLSRTDEHQNGARPDEGLLTSAVLISPASLPKLVDSSVNKSVMNRHINQQKKKSSSQVKVMGPCHIDEMLLQKKANNHSFKCLECDFSTSVKTSMNSHKKRHQQNGKFKCQYCSYKSDFRSAITLHFKHGHHRNLNLLETPARIQEVPLEARLRKQFGIKECRVILHDVQLLPVKVLNPENAELLPPSNEEVDIAEDENGKIQPLEIQLRSPEERARIFNEERQQISSKKTEVEKKIEEKEGKKALLIHNLLLEHRNLLEMLLVAHETGEEPSEILKESVEEEIKSLEDEIKLVDGELQALKEEGGSRDQNKLTNPEADQVEYGNDNVMMLQSRLKVLEERVRNVNEEVKEISSKKMDVQKKINEIEERKALMEYNLRLEQSNLLKLNRSALETGEEPSEMLKQLMEEEVNSLENERGVVENELRALKEEEKSLDQNLKDVRGSHLQVVEVLKALLSELDELL